MLIALLLAGAALAAAAGQAGEVVTARGIVIAHAAQGAARIIGARSLIFEGDVVTTGVRSLVVLKMTDGTRVVLRPDSSFQVERFDITAQRESALFTLFKGGLRAVTGFVSKRNPNAMRLRTSVATLGIRGTEFDARLCGEDCVAEAKKRPAPSGRAGFVKGNVLARAENGQRARALVAGGPVYEGDSVITSTGAYALIVFRDRSRVTLLPDTEFRIDRLEFDDADAERGAGVFSLLRGGLRAVTGLIGRRGGRGYQMRTPVATIGIRGTGYDAICKGTCQNPDEHAGIEGDGLITHVWDGGIVIDDGEVVGLDESRFIGNRGFAPIPVPDFAALMGGRMSELGAAPAIDMPLADLPVEERAVNPRVGDMVVSLHSGHVSVEPTGGAAVEMQPGTGGVIGAGGGPLEPLREPPGWQVEDRTLKVVGVDSLPQGDGEEFGGPRECTVR